MSKRQALGAITNSNVVLAASAAATAAGGTTGATLFNQNVNIFKQAQKSSATCVFNNNNENQPPPSIKSSMNNKPGGEFEFEIFQEERQQNQRNPLGSLPVNRLREKSQVNFFLDVQEEAENDDVEEEDEEQEDVHDKRKLDEEDDDDEDEDEDEKENDDGLEEEGISRLNIAAMLDSASASSQQTSKDLNTSQCELMMDSSSSTNQDESMLLDDTIKDMKSAASSLYIDDEDSEIEEEEENASYDVDEADDEEIRQRQASLDRDNVTMNFMEYKDEILSYMRRLELENRPKAAYMKKQMDITANMRSILVDWLVEVCEEYKLNVETLYLAVNYTDRFLSQMSVLRGKLQLVGTASMYIAAKYEEVAPPDITEFVYITDDTYTRKQVLRMEHLLLKVLDFKMSSPTANWFLSHFLRFIRQTTSLSHSNNTELGQRIENLARYLCELTLIESDTFLAYLPSQIAASAVYLSMYTLGRPWTKQVADLCGYSHDLNDLKPCIQEMFKSLKGALDHPQQAIQEKYKQSKYDYVALIEPPKTLPPHLV